MPERHPCLAIVGPTASGKSALGMQLAQELGLEILCCDSVQVYRGLDIGSAKASAEDRAKVPHHLLDLVEPDMPFSAADFSRAAEPFLKLAPRLIIGGTGLYLRSLALTTTQVPGDLSPNHPERQAFEREWLAAEATTEGAVHTSLAERDPATAQDIHPRNNVRALRALWLCHCSGEPVSEIRRRNPPQPRMPLRVVVLDPGVPQVDANIARRCEGMFAAGFVGEVQRLIEQGYAGSKALASLGYRQVRAYLEGRVSLLQAQAEIVAETRAYARRQRTFFRHRLPPHADVSRVASASAVDASELKRWLGEAA